MAIVNLPLQGDFCQSQIHADLVVAFALQRANTLEVPIGTLQANWVASLASLSALSFPRMLQWIRHHATSIKLVGSLLRNFVILW